MLGGEEKKDECGLEPCRQHKVHSHCVAGTMLEGV